MMSGLAALILRSSDIDLIEQHLRETLRCLLRLHEKTPRCVVYFLAGCLPGSALLHLRQLSLFGMITRLTGNILHTHARNVFNYSTVSPKSWFVQIRNLCCTYDLPHPQVLLVSPLSKESFKKLMKQKVTDYWEIKLREEARKLKSLLYFKPEFISLKCPHPIWTSAGYSPYNIAKATVQAIMLSGRYRFGALFRHWVKGNGCCTLSLNCANSLDNL